MEVQDLLSVRKLQGLRVVAGSAGLHNEMQDVVILEYENLKQQAAGYYSGDFLITSLVFAKDEPSRIAPVIRQLVAAGAAGLAVKTVYFSALPPEAVQTAQANDFPVLLFDDVYMEDVIIAITDYIRNQQNFSTFERELRQLIEQNLPGQQVKSLCQLLNPQFRGFAAAAYFCEQGPRAAQTARDVLDSLTMRPRNRLLGDYRFLQYGSGVFLVYNSKSPQQAGQAEARLLHTLQLLGVDLAATRVGVSGVHTRESDFDACIRESFYAYLYACIRNLPRCRYQALGCYRFAFPALHDKCCMAALHELVGRMQHYDKEGGAALLETLRCYAAQGCNVQATAQHLCQHPNTVRYRLKRVQELLGQDADKDSPTPTLYWLAVLMQAEEAYRRT